MKIIRVPCRPQWYSNRPDAGENTNLNPTPGIQKEKPLVPRVPPGAARPRPVAKSVRPGSATT